MDIWQKYRSPLLNPEIIDLGDRTHVIDGDRRLDIYQDKVIEYKNGMVEFMVDNGIFFFDKGRVVKEEYGNKVISRSDPDTMTEYTYKDGKLHSYDDKPSTVVYPNGQLESLEWHKDGKWHRAIGPAWILYLPNDDIVKLRWYSDGICVYGENYSYGIKKIMDKEDLNNES